MACDLDDANAGLACLVSLVATFTSRQCAPGRGFPHIAGGVGLPQLLPHQHSPAPHQLSAAAVPGMTAVTAGDPGQQLLGAGQLHHQQQLAIASLAAAAGGVAGGVAGTKKRQRDSSEELLLVQT